MSWPKSSSAYSMFIHIFNEVAMTLQWRHFVSGHADRLNAFILPKGMRAQVNVRAA